MASLLRKLGAALFVAVLFLNSAGADPPNVVILVADDLGWNAVSYHAPAKQTPWIHTPHIDRLNRQGVELDRFYVAPMCSPTRAGLLTGRYPIRFGLARAVIPPQRNFGLPTDERTLAEALGEWGYQHRGIFGKWHLGHHQAKWHPLAQGFTHFQGHYNGAIDYFEHTRNGERDWHVDYEPTRKHGYSTDLIAEAASAFIREVAEDSSPYFCYVPFNAPHSPFQAKPDDTRRAETASNENANGKKLENTYRAMVLSLDDAVGEILEAIDDTGESDNTQVWFLSDNGGVSRFAANNRPLRGSKLTTFEGGIRVPACVRWPAQWQAGHKVSHTMGYIDVLPTVLASAGGDLASDDSAKRRPLDGIDLGGVLKGDETPMAARDWFSYQGQTGLESETIAVRTPKWKLVVNGPDVRRGPINDQHQVFLFQMPDDEWETHNLADEHPDIVKRLYPKIQAYRDLQPEHGVAPYRVGAKGFRPWKDWRIKRPLTEASPR